MTDIQRVEGIAYEHAKELSKAGVLTTEDLLREGATVQGRKDIEYVTSLPHKLILKWVNMVDLFRIKGISEEYSELLQVSGVNTVPELALRNPEHLYDKMVEVNSKKNLVRKIPSEKMISGWIEKAKNLPRIVEY
jgi:predicted RecB family nuclease